MRWIWRLAGDESGHTIMMIAMSAPVVIATLGLGVDASMGYFAKERMQNAADQAALSAARARATDKALSLTDQAEFIADKSGFGIDDGATIVANSPPSSGPNTGDPSYIEVLISRYEPQYFSALFGDRPTLVAARAVARFSQGSSTCVLVLDKSASKAMNVSGGATVALDDCDLQVNSVTATALNASGGAIVRAQNAMIAGLAALSGGAVVQTTESYQTHAPQIDDPFASAPEPTAGTCVATGWNTSAPATLYPGTYCGGLTVKSGGDVLLKPGVYVIDGGKLTVSGGGKLIGKNVTIFFTSSSGSNWGGAVFSGSSIVDLSAPTTGSTAGLTIFGARSMPLNTKFDFSGGSDQKIDGVLYAPRAFVNYSGGSTISTPCTTIVANTLQFSGSATLTSSACDVYGKSMGASSIALAE